MGQKVHPVGFRLGFNKDWESRWFARKDYKELLHEDLKLRNELKKRFQHAGVSKIELERAGKKLTVALFTSRPGIIIGKKGAEVDKLKEDLQKRTGREVYIKIEEIHRPETDAQLVADGIGMQIVKRVSFRRAMKRAMEISRKAGALGIKIRISGRLNGAEIARTEWYLDGRLPLQTLRSDIDYGFGEAFTTYGTIGIKVWIFKGEKVTK
ncbi:MAG TPA: 30S ribosomal protein S3 [Acidobacteriota bacterium]|nr:30S ribosomal protein S3 [Acidobacteriota bacterium]HNT16476.1 30S ribosomal protein S3 [Acidobacteriota bacterium]HPA27274.1 30S ribosomal protein S3 [Acidobacteriota bacterium]HQO20558.1 30S ribosomal protein S3 [Acidobacteriota bacterium]HQQ47056.1 30S ribosomal protein S3 [Acidobacteriota bacterium]